MARVGELSKELKKLVHRKKIYFLWKNKLSNVYNDYSKVTEQEFINKYCKDSEISFNFLIQWEKTDEYARLMYLLLKEKMNTDFVEIYNSVIDKAKSGDEKSIKTFLTLQKEVKNNLSDLNEKSSKDDKDNEDDGLVLD